jgi:hypothetical protein
MNVSVILATRAITGSWSYTVKTNPNTPGGIENKFEKLTEEIDELTHAAPVWILMPSPQFMLAPEVNIMDAISSPGNGIS